MIRKSTRQDLPSVQDLACAVFDAPEARFPFFGLIIRVNQSDLGISDFRFASYDHI